MKMGNLILILSLFFTSCKKQILEPLPPFNPCAIIPCDTSKIEMVWQNQIWHDTMELGSMPALLFGDEVVFSQETLSLTDTIKVFNKYSGSQIKKWSDYFPERIKYMSGGDPIKVNDNIVFTTWNDVYAINSTSGQTIWRTKTETGTGDPFLNHIGNTVYHGRYDRRNATNHASYLIAADIHTGVWDTVHTQAMVNSYQPFHGKPALWVDANGDSILVFQVAFLNPVLGQAEGNKIDVVGLHLQSGEEYFRFTDVDPGHTGSRRYPYLVGDKMFVPLGANMICIDMPSKTIQWRKVFDAGFTSGQPFIYVEGKFFVNPDNRNLYQLDMETGAILWQDLDNGSGASDMVYHKGVLYYTCSGNGKIYAVEVATGKKIWAEPSPNKYKHPLNGDRVFSNANIGFGGVAIDSVNNLLYTSDFYFHMCLKLPKQ